MGRTFGHTRYLPDDEYVSNRVGTKLTSDLVKVSVERSDRTAIIPLKYEDEFCRHYGSTHLHQIVGSSQSLRLVDEAKNIALKDYSSLVFHCLYCACHFGRVEILMLVRRHRGVEIRQQRRDGHLIRCLVRSSEQILNGTEYELFSKKKK